MPVIRPDFHTRLATRVLEDIFYERSRFFYYLGKIEPWGDEHNPPTVPDNTFEQDTIIRNNLVYMRKVSPNDASLVTTSYTWTSGTVYTQWDHTQDMFGQPFYCITDDYNVYKCLNNNHGAASTTKPSGSSLFPIETADGYLWKYMYNVPPFKRKKFLSLTHIPVQKALTDSFYSKGAVESVVVAASGSGYTNVPLTWIEVAGTTTGVDGTASISSVGPLGEITGLDVVDGGTGYTNGAIVKITSEFGTGAEINIVAADGVITGFNIINGGVNYQLTDTVTILVGEGKLEPVIAHNTGSIVNIKITNPGAGYVGNPTLTVHQPSQGNGTGKFGNLTAIIKAFTYNGSIVQATIEDPGVDYPFDTSTTISIQGDGTGSDGTGTALFTPVVDPTTGEVVDVVVEDPGVGYTYIELTVNGTGTGAKVSGIIGASDFLSDQSRVEQTATKGAIYAIVVTVPGNNYSGESTVNITGDGTGATAHPVIGEDGSIAKIVVDSYGQNYTWATITINDPNRLTPNNFTDCVSYAVFPPINGHGFDAVRELHGDTIAVFSQLRDDTELNLIAQDYRQYGLITNPTDILTSKIVQTEINFVVFDILLNNVGDLAVDEVLVNNNRRYRVVEINNNTIKVQQLNPMYVVPSGMFQSESTSQQYSIKQVTSVPSVNKYSGNLYYVTNTVPFTPTGDSSIVIRTYIKL